MPSELPSFKAHNDLLRIQICRDDADLLTPNAEQSPQFTAREGVADERLRSSSQIHREVILEREEDNFKATNAWSNSK